MEKINLSRLNEAAVPGGPSALSETTNLMPAAGEQSLVAPAKYLSGSKACYVFETRDIEGGPKKTVLIDSRTSMANRLEDVLQSAIDEGNPILSKMPRMIVHYETQNGSIELSDLQLPHRFVDAHFRLGTVEGVPINKCEAFRAARNATQRNAWDLLKISVVSVLFGAWDSTRKMHQLRLPSCVTGEIIGVVADQGADPEVSITKRSGARIDPIAAKIEFTSSDIKAISAQITEGTADGKSAAKASNFVIGAIPPSTDAIDGIATSSIIRSYVLSFSTLRRLHFGKGTEGDASIRALLAAIAVNAIVRNDSELYLRANAHLVEKEQPHIKLDQRMGKFLELEPMTIDDADRLLEEAYEQAVQKAGIDWHGQVLKVEGNPIVIKGAHDDAEE